MRFLALIIMLCFASFYGMAQAEPVYTGVFNDLAVSGYDTVAYFAQNKAVEGEKSISVDWQGAEWRFSSERNKQTFLNNPEKYAPQYGGYCAYALGAKDDLVSSDPQSWTIVNGKLYLNYDKDIRDRWIENKDDFIAEADKNWVKYKDK
ncbi:MAG: YHS domain protein [Micavibrio sp.]|nr:YHS domain protein [Micavibrio sp.]